MIVGWRPGDSSAARPGGGRGPGRTPGARMADGIVNLRMRTLPCRVTSLRTGATGRVVQCQTARGRAVPSASVLLATCRSTPGPPRGRPAPSPGRPDLFVPGLPGPRCTRRQHSQSGGDRVHGTPSGQDRQADSARIVCLVRIRSRGGKAVVAEFPRKGRIVTQGGSTYWHHPMSPRREICVRGRRCCGKGMNVKYAKAVAVISGSMVAAGVASPALAGDMYPKPSGNRVLGTVQSAANHVPGTQGVGDLVHGAANGNPAGRMLGGLPVGQ